MYHKWYLIFNITSYKFLVVFPVTSVLHTPSAFTLLKLVIP
jgi:hypothetical protein